MTPPPEDPAPSAELVAAARTLSAERLRFAVPACLVSFGGFVVITVLAGFTTVLNVTVVGPLNLLTLLMVLGFPVVGVCAVLYSRRAAEWDRRTEEVLAAARRAELEKAEAR
ncbi:hypothetical protein GCM10009836_19270 [Pseudonocardia ailaonensis]|uniref:DUF485 domain-containing protein n=1 Tax=Pseudonocardia ailaonensis TaxID=367279 RepID=A0ABN2MVE0_9PSEU